MQLILPLIWILIIWESKPYDRYLVVDKTGQKPKRLETPQLFWMRVAMGVFAHEDNPEDQIISLYNLYKSRRFCSSTPTLFNSEPLTHNFLPVIFTK